MNISDERKVASIQAFENGLRVPQERCPRCLVDVKPEDWKEHMMGAVAGDCPLVQEGTGNG